VLILPDINRIASMFLQQLISICLSCQDKSMCLIIEWAHQLISVNINLSCHHLHILQRSSLNPARHKLKSSKNSLKLLVLFIKQEETIIAGIWVIEATAATAVSSNKVTLRYGNQNKQRKRMSHWQLETNRNNKRIMNTIKMIYHQLSQEETGKGRTPKKNLSNNHI